MVQRQGVPRRSQDNRGISRGVWLGREGCDLISPSQLEWPDWEVTEAAGRGWRRRVAGVPALWPLDASLSASRKP